MNYWFPVIVAYFCLFFIFLFNGERLEMAFATGILFCTIPSAIEWIYNFIRRKKRNKTLLLISIFPIFCFATLKYFSHELSKENIKEESLKIIECTRVIKNSCLPFENRHFAKSVISLFITNDLIVYLYQNKNGQNCVKFINGEYKNSEFCNGQPL